MKQHHTLKIIHTSTEDICHFWSDPDYPNDVAPQVVVQSKVYEQILQGVAQDPELAYALDTLLIPPIPIFFDKEVLVEHFKRTLVERNEGSVHDLQGLYRLIGCLYELTFDNSIYFELKPVMIYQDDYYQHQMYIRPLSEMFEIVHRGGHSLPRFCQA
jgi:hypothetical protein